MARIRLVERANSLLARSAFSYSKRAFGKVVSPLKAYAHSQPTLWGTGQMELAVKRAKAVPRRLKSLGSLRVAMRVGCPF